MKAKLTSSDFPQVAAVMNHPKQVFLFRAVFSTLYTIRQAKDDQDGEWGIHWTPLSRTYEDTSSLSALKRAKADYPHFAHRLAVEPIRRAKIVIQPFGAI